MWSPRGNVRSTAAVERIPILKMGEYLLVTIQLDAHDRLAMTLQDDLTSRIVSARAEGALIDRMRIRERSRHDRATS